MFSIAHIAIIFVVVLVVFGPEKLPELARNFGKIMGEFRRATGELRTTFEGHMRDLERETELRTARQKAADPAVMTPLQVATGEPALEATPDATAGTSAAGGSGGELPPSPNFVAADGTVATNAPYSTALREPTAGVATLNETATLPFDAPVSAHAPAVTSSDHDSATAPLLAPGDHKVTDGRSGAA
jgi:sec-independent protein translocase protein TatB